MGGRTCQARTRDVPGLRRKQKGRENWDFFGSQVPTGRSFFDPLFEVWKGGARLGFQ